MEIKIKLPHNVRVTCPSPESAIIVLRSLRFKADYENLVGKNESLMPPSKSFRPSDEVYEAVQKQNQEEGNSYPNSDVTRTEYGPPATASGRPSEGEGFQAFAGRDRSDHEASLDAEFEELEVLPFSGPGEEDDVEDEEEDSSDSGLEADSNQEKFDDIDEPGSEYLGDGPTIEIDVLEEDESDLRKRNTRSRHAAELAPSEEHEESDFDPQVRDIFLSSQMGERTRKVFDFIQTRKVFTTKDVQKFIKTELGLRRTAKNKRKVRDSLKTIEKTGIIQKIARGEWQKVS